MDARAGRAGEVIEGPFAATEELVAGYWLWQVKSMEEAIEWVSRPSPYAASRDRDGVMRGPAARSA